MFYLNFYYVSFLVFLFFSFMSMFFGLNFLLLNHCLLLEWMLYSNNSVLVTFIIFLDWISLFFVSVVLMISSLVILYSSVYMGNYNYSSLRFLFLVLCFVLSMFLMVLSPSLVSILLGWDGLGLVSYCLVIYYSSLGSYLSGMITCLINRLGDIGLLISICWVFSYGSWNFMFYNFFYEESIFYLVIISSFTKSAQIPFSSWLPAAMAAPTPVSSLVHSSTLVTAGVYLLIRFFHHISFLNEFFLMVGVLTMIMSSFCANCEFDVKKIIALSTLSQLGLMMSCLFMGLVDLSYFHLLSHAMFKSLLFLCSGIIIHLMGGCQDIRSMGSICLSMPITCCCFNISSMSLCGFPFLAGFYSSDMIIEYSSFSGHNFLVFLLFYIGLGLTASYSIRLFYYTVLIYPHSVSYLNFEEQISYMMYSITLLSVFSVLFGSVFTWLTNVDLMFLVMPMYLKIITLLFVILGLYIGYELNEASNYFFNSYYMLNGSMWFMYSYSYGLYFFGFKYMLNMNFFLFWGEYYGGLGLSYYMLKLVNYYQFYLMNSFSIFFISLFIWGIFIMI